MGERWKDDNWRRPSRAGSGYEPSVAGSSHSGSQSRTSRGGGRSSQGPASPNPPGTPFTPMTSDAGGGGSRGTGFGGGRQNPNRGGGGAGGGRGTDQTWRGGPSGFGGSFFQPTSPTSPIAGGGQRGGDRSSGRDTPPRNELIFEEDHAGRLKPTVPEPPQPDALALSFQNLRLASGGFPPRPGYGTAGEPMLYRANYFPIKFPKTLLYEYRIKVEPKPAITRIRKRIFSILEAMPEFASFRDHIVHDHANRMIASRRLPLPNEGVSIVLRYFDADEPGPTARSQAYTVNITYHTQLDVDSLRSYLTGDPNFRDFDATPVISALNIILSAQPSRTGIIVGRNRFFFPDPASSQLLGCGLEALKGYSSSVRPSFRQMMVNVNICTTAFYKAGNLADSMFEFLNGGAGRLNGFVTGLRVQTLHLGHRNKKTIKRVGDLNAAQQTFVCEEYGNAIITVQNYFLRKYEITLRCATDLPVVDVGTSRDKPIWLPAELCEVLPHQPFRGKIPDDATTKMIKYACAYPAKNAAKIVGDGLRNLGISSSAPGGAAPALAEFGIGVGNEMVLVPARVLPPPQIAYGRGTVRVDQQASWNLKDVVFIEPKPLRNWMVLVFRDNGKNDFVAPHDPNLVNILNELSRICDRNGMKVMSDPFVATVTLPPKDTFNDPSRKLGIETIREAYLNILARPNGPRKPEFMLIMLSNGDKNLFDGLKRLFDLQLDVHTICVHTSKIRKTKNQQQFLANVAMKINMKLGGVNHTLDAESLGWLTEEPTMMLGSDVTHPTPESLKGTPSIAAVVGSVDAKFAHYPASLRLQESRKEMITDLSAMVKERLEDYRAKSRRLPKRIIFFRDGVSEGQYQTVVKDELPKIQNACLRMSPGGVWRPKITLVIAGKRHHTRFYPVHGPERKGCDKCGNPRPGSVVDRGVTAIYDHDFFLQAHGGLQGTTRPTHYYVVHDDNKFTADTLQKLINCTSYMFGRATRAVSVIPPAYYADLACDRGRCYIHDLLFAGENGLGGALETEEQVMAEARRLWGEGLGPTVRKSMFYL